MPSWSCLKILVFVLFYRMLYTLLFCQPQKLSSDVFEGLSDDIGDVAELEPVSSSSPPARSSSQGSLFSLDDSNDKENSLRGRESLSGSIPNNMTGSIPNNNAAIRQENKNRLSFKLVRQMKVQRAHKLTTLGVLGGGRGYPFSHLDYFILLGYFFIKGCFVIIFTIFGGYLIHWELKRSPPPD